MNKTKTAGKLNKPDSVLSDGLKVKLEMTDLCWKIRKIVTILL